MLRDRYTLNRITVAHCATVAYQARLKNDATIAQVRNGYGLPYSTDTVMIDSTSHDMPSSYGIYVRISFEVGKKYKSLGTRALFP